jgi:hypothetical protein
VARGVRLARHAYRQRKRQEPPAIVKARFEQNGQMLQCFSAVDLEDDVIHPHGRKADRGYKVQWFEVPFRHFLGKTLPQNRTTVRKPGGKRRK